MLSFYPSPAHSQYYSPLYSSRPVNADDITYLHSPSTSDYYLPRTIDPESHYRRALAEYLVAGQELRRAREEARLRARAEALQRQEEARLLQARIIRAVKERQVQQFKQVLAQERSSAPTTKAANPEVHSLHPHMVPVACSAPERNVVASQRPQTHASFTVGSHSLDPTAHSPANEVCRMYIF